MFSLIIESIYIYMGDLSILVENPPLHTTTRHLFLFSLFLSLLLIFTQDNSRIYNINK